MKDKTKTDKKTTLTKKRYKVTNWNGYSLSDNAEYRLDVTSKNEQ